MRAVALAAALPARGPPLVAEARRVEVAAEEVRLELARARVRRDVARRVARAVRVDEPLLGRVARGLDDAELRRDVDRRVALHEIRLDALRLAVPVVVLGVARRRDARGLVLLLRGLDGVLARAPAQLLDDGAVPLDVGHLAPLGARRARADRPADVVRAVDGALPEGFARELGVRAALARRVGDVDVVAEHVAKRYKELTGGLEATIFAARPGAGAQLLVDDATTTTNGVAGSSKTTTNGRTTTNGTTTTTTNGEAAVKTNGDLWVAALDVPRLWK
mmetsp:Transcript_15250/g.61300  ORF Transcript_15250/g.61300 Transcript_15250/m.61300 type:complete len:277 (-) Transcript_15250:1746-2576(-)